MMLDELRDLIALMRLSGATRVKVGDVDVMLGPEPLPASVPLAVGATTNGSLPAPIAEALVAMAAEPEESMTPEEETELASFRAWQRGGTHHG
jgi:hypothetical protein